MFSPRIAPRAAWLVLVVTAAATAATGLSGCAASDASVNDPAKTGFVTVLAAENFWGSIAPQIGGAHARVSSIIVNPQTDPHSYEPTPADGRQIANANLVVINGLGYDSWATKAVGADSPRPRTLDVGDVLGLKEGDNPHRWYNPADIKRVIGAIVTNLRALDPRDSSYFAKRADQFETVALAPYNALVSDIKAKYSGTPVGASESIFSMLAPALGLELITPYSFLRAISEGTDVLATDRATIDNQIKGHLIKVYVYNSQNATPDIQAQLAECRAAGIPTATITETLSPASATYQDWQTRQLQGIESALAQGTAH